MKPYYQTPDGRVRLYHGDCREILPIVAPPEPRVLVLADPPYGVDEETARRSAGRGKGRQTGRFVTQRQKAFSRDWKPIAGDREPFDPAYLINYPRALLWGWNYYAERLPSSPSLIVWDKRDSDTKNDNADVEVAWTNLGGPARIFRHLWQGTCRASETGVAHLHPTQKPIAFYRWLFGGRGRGKPVVSPGDLVVVPYLGSGPEIPAAMELGLEVIGIDVEREYLDTAIKHRIEPELERARQLDIWAPKPPRAEQADLFTNTGSIGGSHA